MDGLPLEFDLSPTIKNYVMSTAVVNAIISPAGEGKSFGSVVRVVVQAQRCGCPIRAAVVRDTLENIKLSTARTIKEVFAEVPSAIKFDAECKKLTILTNPRIEVDLFGIDDPGALSKLQGPEYAIIWLEEPAPMADRVNAGLSEEVFNAALLRCVRQKLPPYCPLCGYRPDPRTAQPGEGCRQCGQSLYYFPHGSLQISMNPADKDHWTYRRLFEDPDVDPTNPLITKRIFEVPYGENRHLAEVARQAAKAAYKNDPAAYARYVLGRFASVYRGSRVTPQYNSLRHMSTDILVPFPGLISFAMFDGWHNPSCLLGQITNSGQLLFIDTLRLQGSDVDTLLDTQVMPMINSPKWKGKTRAWRIGGDFSMRQPDQSNKQKSAAQVVEEYFPGAFFESGPIRWEIMKIRLATALQEGDHRGEPLILLSADNRLLDKALDGAWHYKTDTSGNVVSRLPAKDEISHVGDPFANAVNILLPTRATTSKLVDYRQHAAKQKKRAQSYFNQASGRGGFN